MWQKGRTGIKGAVTADYAIHKSIDDFLIDGTTALIIIANSKGGIDRNVRTSFGGIPANLLAASFRRVP